MTCKNPADEQLAKYLDVEKNQDLAKALFRSYYRSHQASGKLIADFPEFFLVRPVVLKDLDFVDRASDRLIIEDCVTRAEMRKGYVGVCKWRNPKLNYYWLELAPFPFLLEDEVTEDNESEFFYVLNQFIRHTQENPGHYGDVTAGAETDKDLAMMLDQIKQRGAKIEKLFVHYPPDMLVRFNPAWPLPEVNKLLNALKNSEREWCELFFEHVMYVMAQKRR